LTRLLLGGLGLLAGLLGLLRRRLRAGVVADRVLLGGLFL
jgi:hypothetical protein